MQQQQLEPPSGANERPISGFYIICVCHNDSCYTAMMLTPNNKTRGHVIDNDTAHVLLHECYLQAQSCSCERTRLACSTCDTAAIVWQQISGDATCYNTAYPLRLTPACNRLDVLSTKAQCQAPSNFSCGQPTFRLSIRSCTTTLQHALAAM